MKDLLAGFPQQTSDMNIPAPSNGAVNDLGAPTAKPTGRIDYGQVADSLRDMPSAPQGAPSSAPPSLPQSDNSAPPAQAAPQEGATGTPQPTAQTPNPTPVAPPAPAPAPKTDLLSGFSEPVSVQAQNQAAVNPPQPPAVQNYVQQQTAQDTDIASKLFSPAQIAEFKANPISLSNIGSMGHLFNVQQILPGANFTVGTYESVQLAGIDKKIQGMSYQDAMHSLTINEQQLLTDNIKRAYEIKMRGFATGFSGGTAEAMFAAAPLPSWMVSFAAGGELSAIGKAALGGAGGAVAATAIGGAARLATFYPQIAAGTGDALLNDSLAITDKGQMFLRDAQESQGHAFLKSMAYTSEDLAAQLYGGKALEAIAKTPLTAALNQLPAAWKEGIYRAYQAINPSAQMSKVFSTFGWQGVLQQLGINRIDQVLHATTNLATTDNFTAADWAKQAFPTSRQLAIESGLLMIPAGVSAATHAATGIFMQRGMTEPQAQDTVQSMSESEREKFVNESIPVPKSGYQETPEPEVKPSTMSANMDTDIMKSQIKASEKVDPPLVHEDESGFNNLYRKAGVLWKDFYASAVNDTQPIEDLSPKAIKAGAEIPAAQNTENLVTIARNAAGLADANIQFKRMARDPETGALYETGKSLKAIYDDFDNVFQKYEPDWQQRHEDFSTYQTARRQLYLADTREDYKITPDQVEAYHNDIGELSEKYGKDFPLFETLFKENQDWRSGMVHDYLVKTGLKSQEWYDSLLKNNEVYAPSYRELLDEEEQFAPSTSGKLGKNPNADKIGSIGNEATGSDLEIKNVFESDVKNAMQMVMRGENNRLKLAMANKAEFYPDDVRLSDEGGGITYFDNGEKKYMDVSPQIQKAFEGFSQSQRDMIGNWIDKIMTTQKNILQIGATSTPGFFIGHFLRSVQLAFVNSLGDATPMDFIRGLHYVIGNTDEYKEWQAQTGFGVKPMRLDDPTLEEFHNDMFGDKKIMDLVNPQSIHDAIMKYIDHPARLATYEALKREGVPEMEAAVQSLENTMDYGRKGSWVREYGRWSPFLNPPIQTIDRMATLFKDHPAAFTTAAVLSQTIPQLMLTGYYLYGADDQTRKEYLELPSELRFATMNVKIGDHWIPIRRPFTVGYIFGSMPEQLMIHSYQNNRPEPENFYSNMVSGLMKSAGFVTDPAEAIPPMFKSILEAMTNHNLYFNTSLYPDYKKTLPAYARTNNGDTDFSKWLGKKLDMSPAVIDNTISEMSGNLGKWVVSQMDAAGREVSKMEGKPVSEPPSGFENSTMSHGLVDRDPTGFNSQSVQTFYQRFDKANEAHSEMNALQKQSPEDVEQFQKDNMKDLQGYEALADTHKELMALNKQVKAVKSDVNMNGDQKQAFINRLNQQMTEIARQANVQYSKSQGENK
jgi:hypothetical protein